ncbi:hypothetical protein HC928_25585 [bacterium]|nr:hypothetical protein [bacterium]
MNIQTERLEDHTARLTVEIDAERLEKAKRSAAKQIARQVNIPGFRKGKAPYHIVVRNFGEATILNEAVEELSQQIYRETLEQSEDLQPYGPGAWDDFKLEPSPTFIYTVPLKPTVELGDYRSVRVDYEAPQTSDAAVDEAMERLRQQEALVEEVSGPVELHHRVTLDIHSEFVDEAPAKPSAEDEAVAEASSDDTTPVAQEEDAAVDPEEAGADDHDAAGDEEEVQSLPQKGDAFIHEHDATVVLDPDDEPVMVWFNDHIIGISAGEAAEFELTVPDDDPDYEDIAGRRVHFHVTVKKVESVTLPELNDQFAARVTEDEEEPLTLLQLRMRIRDNLQEELTRRYDEAYAGNVLDSIVKQATIAFPDAMVEEQMDAMVEDLESNLRQQGISLDVYTRVTGQDKDAIRAQYREPAIESVRRGLVLTYVMEAEQVSVSDEDIDARIEEMLTRFGASAEGLRSLFDTPAMRDNIARDLLNAAGMKQMSAIGRGIAPEPRAANQPDEPVVEAGDEPASSDEVEAPEPVAAVEAELEPVAEVEADVAEAADPEVQAGSEVNEDSGPQDTGDAKDDAAARP